MIKLLQSKLHRFTVTSADVDYIGSIAVDAALMEEAGIVPLQEVDIVNLNNGNRWTTYALPAPKGTGAISPNGGGALLCEKGDVLIIFGYTFLDAKCLQDAPHQVTVLVGDDDNHVSQRIEQTVSYDPKSGGFAFSQSSDEGMAVVRKAGAA